MKIYPTFEQVQNISNLYNYSIVPIATEIYSDFITPIEVLKKLKSCSKHCYMLESIEDNRNWGRYTFLGYDPAMEITCTNSILTIKGKVNKKVETSNPSKYIRQILKMYKSKRIEGMPTFTGGLVGYFSYDYMKYVESNLEFNANDEEHFKDLDLMLFDKVIAFDNYKQKIIIIQNMKLDNLESEYKKAVESIETIKDLVKDIHDKENNKLTLTGKLKSEYKLLFSKEEYVKKVEQVKRHIREGDIFQLVLSNRLEAKYEGSLFNMYRILRTLNPSPYMFYFSSDDIEMAGASPETLVKLENGMLHTFPLAGTRKRGETINEDKALENDLLSDEKELAEHNMLVDLGRNDLGKICRFGSVEVEKYMEIQRFSHVMHIGSTVRGIIREDKDALDAIEAVLPAGTLSGAPKIRACQIIDEFENCKRGIYGGAIGYIDFTGNMDTCIAIRIAFKKNGKVFIRSGAGIVADSIPEKEFEECQNKAMAVINAIKISEGSDE